MYILKNFTKVSTFWSVQLSVVDAFQTISMNFGDCWWNVSNVPLNFSLLCKLKECFDLTVHLQHPMLCQWVRMYTLQCLCWANESALLPMFCLQRTLTCPVLPPRWHYWHSHGPDQKCLSHRFGHVFLFSFLSTPQPCWVSTLTHLIHYFQIYSVFRIVGYGPSQDKWYWWSYREDTTVSLFFVCYSIYSNDPCDWTH